MRLTPTGSTRSNQVAAEMRRASAQGVDRSSRRQHPKGGIMPEPSQACGCMVFVVLPLTGTKPYPDLLPTAPGEAQAPARWAPLRHRCSTAARPERNTYVPRKPAVIALRDIAAAAIYRTTSSGCCWQRMPCMRTIRSIVRSRSSKPSTISLLAPAIRSSARSMHN